MFKWMDRVYLNARKKIFKNLDTGEILNLELQDDPDNIVTESDTPLTSYCLNMAQQELVDDMSKTYIGTNITAPTVAGYGRINKLYGKTTEEGTGEKSPDNPYTLKCVGDDVNLFDKKFRQGSYNSDSSFNRLFSTQSLFLKAGTYTVSTNLDINTFRMVVAIAKSEFPVTDTQDLIFDSGWQTQRKYTFTFDTDGYFGIGIAKISGDNLTVNDIDAYWFKLQKGPVSRPYSPYGYGTAEVITKNGENQSSNICYVRNGLDEGEYIDYKLKKIVRIDGTTEDIDCSDKIVQYADSTNIYNRDGAEIEVELTNNKAISRLNEEDMLLEEKQRQMSNYSTEEQVVGRWIDGKPLYRKVINISLSSNASVSTNVSSLYIDTLVSLNGLYNYTDANLIYKRPPYYGSSSDFFLVFYRENTIETRVGSVKSDSNILITLEYTKTTD